MRATPLVITLLVLLTLAPTVSAAWTTSANVPSSFRPGREVTFSYTASSSSGLDTPLRWRVTLYTCQDLDADNWCEPTDAYRVDHGPRQLTPAAASSQTVMWAVALNTPEGAYRYHFHLSCIDNPCIGPAPAAADNRTGAFQLAYADTWKRSIVAPATVRQGDIETIQYRLESTSPDDRDLTGTGQLHTTPAGHAERAHAQQAFTAVANQQTTIAWSGIDFPTYGTTTLRVTDTTGPETMEKVEVRAVHLHVTIPRASYTAGNAFSLYFTLEGHGAESDPEPLEGRTLIVRIANGTTLVRTTTLTTDWRGQAYLRHETTEDDSNLTWTASTSLTWLGGDYDIDEKGDILVAPASLAAIAENVTAIREAVEDVQLKGVHLDDVGARNLWITSLRAVGAVGLAFALVFLTLFVIWRT
jgi:hypothetical protein